MNLVATQITANINPKNAGGGLPNSGLSGNGVS